MTRIEQHIFSIVLSLVFGFAEGLYFHSWAWAFCGVLGTMVGTHIAHWQINSRAKKQVGR